MRDRAGATAAPACAGVREPWSHRRGIAWIPAFAGMTMCCAQAIAQTLAAPKTANTVYACDEGKIVVVEQAVPLKPDNPIKLTFGYRQHTMKHVAAGSGARYMTEGGEVEWWSKGEEGFLTEMPSGIKLASNCRVVKPAS